MHNKNPSKFLSRRNIIADVTGGRTDTGTGGGGGGSTTPVNLAVYCMYVTLTNYDLNGTETVDGESPSNGDRILVANQTDAKQNGIYIYNSSGAWTRATDLVPALQISILGGTKQGTIWVVETPTFEIGVDNISIIESAISRKDESFSLGFDAVSNLMSMDKFIIQASDNVLRVAEIDDIFDTYGARGDWDFQQIKTADTRVTGTTFADVSEMTIDLDADSEYEWEVLSLATTKISPATAGIYMAWLYSGTFEHGNYFTNYGYNNSAYEVNGSFLGVVYANTSGTDTTIDPYYDVTTGLIKTTTSGTLKAQIKGWSASNIATLHAGSVFRVRKLDSFTNFQPSSGEANTGVNVGGEKEVYKSMSGTALQFRTLKEGTNVTLTQNTNDITIDVAGGGFWDATISKTTDKSVTSSTTFSDDSELQFSLDASSTYIGEIWIIWDRDTSGGDPYGKIDFAYTGTLTTGRGAVPSNITLSGTWSTVGSGNFPLLQPDSANQYVKIELVFETSTSGTLKVQWAQQVSQSGASILRAGTTMSIKKVK